MTDTKETNAADFTQSFDARDWAHAFVEIVDKVRTIPTDEACMIGWFANALMRGWDEHARKYPDAEDVGWLRETVREFDREAAATAGKNVGGPAGRYRDAVLMAALKLGRTEPIVNRRPNAWNPQETLFAFLGWLTSRRQAVTFSAHDDAGVAVELVTAFAKRHGLSDCRYGWERLIVPESLLVPESPIDLDAVKERLAPVCYGKRWVDVLRLTEEIERLRKLVEAANVHSVDQCAGHGEPATHQATVAISRCLTEPPPAESNQFAGRSAEPTARPSSSTSEARVGLRTASGNSADLMPPVYSMRALVELLERARPIVAEAIALSSEVRTPTFEMNNCLAAIDLALTETTR